MASKLDPENYGDTAKTQVNISLGDLHLQALKHMGKVEPITLENNEEPIYPVHHPIQD
jgi:hypothetical protein